MASSFPLPDAQIAQLKIFVNLLQTPDIGAQLLHAPQLEFFRDYLTSLGAQIPVLHSSAADSKSEEEKLELSEKAKDQAKIAFSEGKYQEALQFYSESIQLNPNSASLVAKRAEVQLKLGNYAAAVKDCDKAIALNKNSANAYLVRGKAFAAEQQWQKAFEDVRHADQLDPDCGAYELLREYKVKASETSGQAQEKPKEQNAGGGGFNFNFADALKNPEIIGLLANPKIQGILGEVMSNPSAITKYMNDPEIAPLIQKAMGMFGGGSATAGNSFSGDAEANHQTGKASDIDVD
jgi:suppressor of tumorigenicity protein 13